MNNSENIEKYLSLNLSILNLDQFVSTDFDISPESEGSSEIKLTKIKGCKV